MAENLNKPLLFRNDIVQVLRLSMKLDKRKRPLGWRTVRKWAKYRGLPLSYDPAGRAVCVCEDLMDWIRINRENKNPGR